MLSWVKAFGIRPQFHLEGTFATFWKVFPILILKFSFSFLLSSHVIFLFSSLFASPPCFHILMKFASLVLLHWRNYCGRLFNLLRIFSWKRFHLHKWLPQIFIEFSLDPTEEKAGGNLIWNRLLECFMADILLSVPLCISNATSDMEFYEIHPSFIHWIFMPRVVGTLYFSSWREKHLVFLWYGLYWTACKEKTVHILWWSPANIVIYQNIVTIISLFFDLQIIKFDYSWKLSMPTFLDGE